MMKVLPGDLVSVTAGAILADWTGPCERLRLGEWEPGIVFGLFDAAADVYLVGQGRTHRTLIDHIRLDADRAEVRDHCAHWLARHHLVAVGATAPTWAWAIVRGRDVWMLDERVISDRAPGEHPFDALVLACLAAGGRS